MVFMVLWTKIFDGKLYKFGKGPMESYKVRRKKKGKRLNVDSFSLHSHHRLG